MEFRFEVIWLVFCGFGVCRIGGENVTVNETDPATTTIFTTATTNPTTISNARSQPGNLTATNVTSTSFTITWTDQNDLVDPTYQVGIVRGKVASANHSISNCSDLPKPVRNFTVNGMVLVVEALAADFNYFVHVGGTSVNVTTLPGPSQVAENVFTSLLVDDDGSRDSPLSLYVSWDMPCNTNGPLQQFILDLQGFYIHNLSVVDRRTTNISTLDVLVYRFEGLMSASNYTLSIRAGSLGLVYNEILETTPDNLQNATDPPTTTSYTTTTPGYTTTTIDTTSMEPTTPTKETQPGNLTATNVTSTSFTLTWIDQNDLVNVTYQVRIVRGKVASANHSISNCSDLPEPVQNFTVNEMVLVVDALADFNYSVYVGEASVNVTTLPGPSQVVENVNSSLIVHDDGSNVTTSLNVSWNMPCNTNGPLQQFILVLEGFYIHNASNVDRRTKNISILDVPVYRFEGLMSASNYTLIIRAGPLGSAYNKTLNTTRDNYPSPPIITVTVNLDNFKLHWIPPSNNPGQVILYTVDVDLYEVHWPQTQQCVVDSYSNQTNSTINELVVENTVPDSTYQTSIRALTLAGYGEAAHWTVTTKPAAPEVMVLDGWEVIHRIDDKVYNVSYEWDFTMGCLNGRNGSWSVNYTGKRSNFADQSGSYYSEDFSTTIWGFPVQPQYNYTVNFTLTNVGLNTTNSSQYNSPIGVPAVNNKSNVTLETNSTQTKASIVLEKKYFGDLSGDLSHLSILVSNRNVTGGEFGSWDGTHWPAINTTEAEIYYQSMVEPLKFLKLFEASDSYTYLLGTNESCEQGQNLCNSPLKPSTTYYVMVRMYNSRYYRNTMPTTIITTSTSRLGVILGSIFGVLLFSLIGFVGFIVWKRGTFHLLLKPKKPLEHCTEISRDKFPEYFMLMQRNPHILQRQWTELREKSDQIYQETQNKAALMPENRTKKNRYPDILPFDHSRVKLAEDDDVAEEGSDYINASYIQGFSNKNEYIATQGPKRETARDFWLMIFQQNISVVVMVAQFVENSREKCFKYFPANRGMMSFGDDIEVRCCTELNFKIYVVRTLQVRKDDKQMTVTHMQFTEWPDKDIPEGTENIMLFMQQFRSRWASEGGMAVVHCSAGVGRTGTIIATDIIMKAIDVGKKIDVFNTVLNLRRQRILMVQTERQYWFIHQLIKNYLEEPLSSEEENSEHVYQNVDLIQHRHGNVVESAL